MKGKQINPSIGGYFKHEDKVYRAVHPLELGKCFGCNFYKPEAIDTTCHAPTNLNCKGKVYEDVTGMVTDELIDERPERNYNPLAVTSILLIGVMVFGYVMYKVIIKLINFLQ